MVVYLYSDKKKEASVGKFWIDMNNGRNTITTESDSCVFV